MNTTPPLQLRRGKEPIRVLHVISGLGTGGAETFLLRLLSSQSTAVEGRVVSLSRGGGMVPWFRDAGIPLAQLGLKDASGMARLPVTGWKTARCIRSWRPHIIQGWMNHGNLGAWIARRSLQPSARLIWSIRQTVYEIARERRGTQWAIRLQAKLSSDPEEIICNSAVGRDQHSQLGFRSDRMSVIPNGFDVDQYRPMPERRAAARALLGMSGEGIVIGMIARHHAMKDYPCFLEAVAMVMREVPQLQAVCIGRGVDSVEANLRLYAQKLNLSNACLFLDERTDLEQIYPGIDVLCLTSAWGEGFPNVLGEAMACGIPCVATDVGDASLIIGDCGMVVPPRTPTGVAAAVLELVRMGGEARTALGEKARRRIVREFSMSAISKEYLRVYRRLVAAA